MQLPDTFRNRHGERLDASFHPASREDVLFVLGHGVTANKDRPLLVAVAEGLAAKGWPCLRFSFAGNGGSEGDFRDATISRECGDLADLLDQLPDGLRLAYGGHSMGGAVGLRLAAGDPRVRVLVSLAGMVRTARFFTTEFGDQVPGEGLMWDDPDCPLSRAFAEDMAAIGDLFGEVDRLSVPWLLVHGDADDVVRIDDSRDAFARAREPKRLVEIAGAGHMFDEQSHARIVDEIDAWLGEFLGRP